ncbi:MAG TPA: (2Fe-2S)-binding protein [Actinospica sp.]|nr:(2Fe-2S)-binding protein [Actinospica sp.]
MTDQGMRLELTVNGRRRVATDVPPFASLLSALREHFGLPGAKNACEQGECGSCTVFLDGTPVCSCLVAAGQAEGREVTTVEGLADEAGLSLVQRAFVAAGAVQCGFCTPGFLMAVRDLQSRARGRTIINLDDEEVREALAGNLCRCTGYEKVIDAVRAALAHPTDPQRAVGASG